MYRDFTVAIRSIVLSSGEIERTAWVRLPAASRIRIASILLTLPAKFSNHRRIHRFSFFPLSSLSFVFQIYTLQI